MIGKNLLKGLLITGAAVAVATPLISTASTHYTGKTPASIAMMAANGGVSVTPLTTTHKHLSHHKAIVKASMKHHSKKHIKLSSKKKV